MRIKIFFQAHRSVILLWGFALLTACVSTGFRMFLPNYYSAYPGIWHIWLKETIAVFAVTLMVVPTGVYRRLPKLLRRCKLNNPWLCCLAILPGILAVYFILGQGPYPAKNIAATLVVCFLLFLPRMESNSLGKPAHWLLPTTLLLLSTAAVSYLLPWEGGRPDYHLAVAVGCAMTSWLLVSMAQLPQGSPHRRYWLAFVPAATAFLLIVVLHISLSPDTGAAVEQWRSGENFYTAMRGSDPAGTTCMNIVIPVLNVILGIMAAVVSKKIGKQQGQAIFLLLLFVMLTTGGLLNFYAVIPGMEPASYIMPYKSFLTALPLGLCVSSILSHSFDSKRNVYPNDQSDDKE